MLRVEWPLQMAQCLARHLENVAVLHENSPIIYALIKLDEIHGDPAAVAATLGEALNANLLAPPADIFGPPHFAAGRWREFSAVLADPFAVLTPVAQRLGYHETCSEESRHALPHQQLRQQRHDPFGVSTRHTSPVWRQPQPAPGLGRPTPGHRTVP